MKTNKNPLAVKSVRVELAMDTIESIDKLSVELRERKDRRANDLEGWVASRERLAKIVEKKGESQESMTLDGVAEANIRAMQGQLDATHKELARLDGLRTRALHAKGTFEVFEDTRYLVEKSGLQHSMLANPETEIQEIRRAVFNLEGHKEILA